MRTERMAQAKQEEAAMDSYAETLRKMACYTEAEVRLSRTRSVAPGSPRACLTSHPFARARRSPHPVRRCERGSWRRTCRSRRRSRPARRSSMPRSTQTPSTPLSTTSSARRAAELVSSSVKPRALLVGGSHAPRLAAFLPSIIAAACATSDGPSLRVRVLFLSVVFHAVYSVYSP